MKSGDNNHTRYILDAIYGVIYFPDYIWEILFVPEIQRLRELRLYNINSLYFTGGANINRFEHSLGTCYLALQCVESNLNRLHKKEKMLIVLAALLHDLYNAAFGHSVEYVENFSPENLFSYAVTGEKYDKFKYKHAEFEPIYFGMCEEISSKLIKNLGLTDKDIKKIGDYINGEGEYGPLISGSIDLDNIDNIYRMSYHMGLTKETQAPIEIAKSIWSHGGNLYIKNDAVPLVREWIHLRERLYKFLLLNPDEFSAKFMLTEAIELSKKDDKRVYAWYDTDFQILEKLSQSSSDVSNVISRLMKGSFYGCFGIYKTSKTEKVKDLSDISIRKKIEKEINELIKPDVILNIPDFSEKEQKIIKGIKGIYYDSKTLGLKLNYKVSKDTIDNLTENELKKHRNHINNMWLNIQEKIKKFKLKSPNFGIHIIPDINKTNREVTLRLMNDEIVRIGSQSNYIYIGVFIKNIQFENFNLYNNAVLKSKFVKNIKKEIKDYLEKYLEDPNLEDLKLYSEVQNG